MLDVFGLQMSLWEMVSGELQKHTLLCVKKKKKKKMDRPNIMLSAIKSVTDTLFKLLLCFPARGIVPHWKILLAVLVFFSLKILIKRKLDSILETSLYLFSCHIQSYATGQAAFLFQTECVVFDLNMINNSFKQATAMYSFTKNREKKRQDGNSPNSLETGDTAALSPILDIASKYIFPAKVIAAKRKLCWSEFHHLSKDNKTDWIVISL